MSCFSSVVPDEHILYPATVSGWYYGVMLVVSSVSIPLLTCPSVVHPYFCFRMITWVNVNGFSPNLVYVLILWKSCMGLLTDKFHQFLTELSARDTSIFSFLDVNFSKFQGIFTKQFMHWNCGGLFRSHESPKYQNTTEIPEYPWKI